MGNLSAFKSYDIRGRIGEDLNADLMRNVGRAFAHMMAPGVTVTGRDIRETSPELHAALNQGLTEGGSDVVDIGLCGTEEVYCATGLLEAGSGIMVTASHNPVDWNGAKLVGQGAQPLTGATALSALRDLLAAGTPKGAATPGTCRSADLRARYVDRVLSFVDPAELPALTVLVDAGNGAAGPTFDALAEALVAQGAPLQFVRRNHTPDACFPNGVPNPLLPENRAGTGAAVREAGADLGVAWDGDFDRCFLFDETGAFVDGEYVVGLLAKAFLDRHPGSAIVHDPRVIWATQAAIAAGNGRAVVARTGHAHLKAAMRAEDAIYGGEMSAHHYFRDFFYCDSGMIPWLLVTALIGRSGRSLSALVAEARAAYPSSGEINFRLEDPVAAMERTVAAFDAQAPRRDDLDGVSLDFGAWRFNLRRSNTEPLLRLNVETRGDAAALEAHVATLRALILDQ